MEYNTELLTEQISEIADRVSSTPESREQERIKLAARTVQLKEKSLLERVLPVADWDEYRLSEDFEIVMDEMEEIDLAMARIVAEDERFEAAEKKKAQGAQLETLYGQSRIHWGDLLNSEPVEPDWLCYPFIERGASIAIVSEAKAGKSLLTLEIAANLAAGKSVLGNPAKKVTVLYVDM
jgi:hypothetical protein